MNKTEIKKALYRQKPIAKKGRKIDGYTFYSTEVEVDGSEEEILFKIPNEELLDADGNHIFSDIESAQLLIRWIYLS